MYEFWNGVSHRYPLNLKLSFLSIFERLKTCLSGGVCKRAAADKVKLTANTLKYSFHTSELVQQKLLL